GQMRFVLDGGAVQVDGAHAAQMTATPDATTGVSRIAVVAGGNSRDVTASIAGGSMGAHLKYRDQTIPKVSAQLDQLAFDVTSSVNAVHTAHDGLDGI